jgi:hypothetical protein
VQIFLPIYFYIEIGNLKRKSEPINEESWARIISKSTRPRRPSTEGLTISGTVIPTRTGCHASVTLLRQTEYVSWDTYVIRAIEHRQNLVVPP